MYVGFVSRAGASGHLDPVSGTTITGRTADKATGSESTREEETLTNQIKQRTAALIWSPLNRLCDRNTEPAVRITTVYELWMKHVGTNTYFKVVCGALALRDKEDS